jgi:hypothetical protein
MTFAVIALLLAPPTAGCPSVFEIVKHWGKGANGIGVFFLVVSAILLVSLLLLIAAVVQTVKAREELFILEPEGQSEV